MAIRRPSWGNFGSFRRIFGAILGIMWPFLMILEPYWSNLLATWTQLGSTWRQLGPKLGPTWSLIDGICGCCARDMRMLRQQGRSKIDVFYLHINSHNFHNRKRQLTYLLSKNRSPQDAKVASKTFQNDPKSTPKATTNDPQKILSAYAFQPPASEICLCRSTPRSVRRRCPRLRVQ